MNRIALGIEYDGSRFLGWQTQPGGGTVQDSLEAALATIAGVPVAVTCAGRTDRGVHARGQVVHFDTAADRPDTAWVRGANALLPDSVAVLWSRRLPPEFHARYAARSRTYRYVLVNRAVRPALEARHQNEHSSIEDERNHQGETVFLGEVADGEFISANNHEGICQPDEFSLLPPGAGPDQRGGCERQHDRSQSVGRSLTASAGGNGLPDRDQQLHRDS